MDKSLEEQNQELVLNFVNAITNDAYYSGILSYDVIFDENLYGHKTHLEGLAFSTNGKNIFGCIIDPENYNDFTSMNNRIFAGTYTPDKGMSILFLPLFEPFLQMNDCDFNLNATTRNVDNRLHGKYDAGLVRIDIKRNDNLTQDQVISPYIEMLALLTARYSNKAVELVLKSVKQNENIALIDKIYEQFKDIPIPACFADDGAAPKTKM